MPRAVIFASLIVASLAATAQEQRYVSDELVLVLREAPRADAPARGVVTSGMRVQVLGSDAASGYARVRTGDGRDGWILARYLTGDPPARDRLLRTEKELAAAQAELKKVRDDHARLLEDFSRISGGEPLASREVVAEAERLRAQLAEKEQELAALRVASGAERARQRTLFIGGSLVAGGFLLALLLRWLWPKRRWGDL